MSSESRHYSAGSRIPAFERATVADVMRPGVMSCPPKTSLLVVAQTMTAHNIHAIVVNDIPSELRRAGDQIGWGMISDMDLIRAVPSGTRGRTAHEYARTEAVGIEPSATLVSAAALMITHDTAHLVVSDDGRPTGMVSTLDLAAALALGRG